MTLKDFLEWIENRSARFRRVVVVVIALGMGLATLMVYQAGGSSVVYTHSMYVPVVIAAIVFGLPGGVIAALLGGLLLGPLMPLDVASGESQSLLNWTFRLAYFLLLAMLIGESADLIRHYIKQMRWRLSHHDVTQLPNRQALGQALQQLLDAPGPGTSPAHLYLIDVSNLNELSLKLGGEFEHMAIRTLADALLGRLAAGMQVFQVRTNRLAILASNEAGPRDEEVPRVIEQAVNTPVVFEGIPLLLHCVWSDIGVEQADRHPDVFLRKLELALNEARTRKLQHYQYSKGLELYSRQNVEILGLLKQALDADVLTLKFQPKYRLRDRRLLAVETLLAWTDPERGIMPPAEFIPLAEESLLITPMTLRIIDRAVAEFSRWLEAGHRLQSIAVNISASNLGNGDFIAGVRETVARYGLQPGQLELELTEGAVVADLDVAVAALNELAAVGVAISVDDFGTGFSSLQYLDRLPVHSVKIDQSFIRNMLQRESNRHIVESTIDLAHRLGLTVVAEGIESEAIEKMLVAMGCDQGQGYFFARPMCGSRLVEFMAARSGTGPANS